MPGRNLKAEYHPLEKKWDVCVGCGGGMWGGGGGWNGHSDGDSYQGEMCF